MPELWVWIGARRVGTFSVERTAAGDRYRFEYEPEATAADLVSLTMVPGVHGRSFEVGSFPAPFDMILPEGERRARIEEARKILKTDAFSLLGYVGVNPVNRVRFLAPGAAHDAALPDLPTPREIATCEDGHALFRRLVDELDLRQGIAGVQPKILGRAEHPAKPSPALRNYRGSTHILKASTARFPFLATNEHICQEALRAAGLPVPDNVLSADGQLLLVKRFDVQDDGTLLGFEEAGALMGERAEGKYQRDYGSMFDQLARFVPPADETDTRQDLMKALLLSYLLGNGDAHLKNFGLVYSSYGDARLAPMYDCISTLAYIDDDVPALALSFEFYSKAWWPLERVIEFADQYGGMTHQNLRHTVDHARSAVAHGLELVAKHSRAQPGFAPVGARMKSVMTERLALFKTFGGTPKGRRAKPR